MSPGRKTIVAGVAFLVFWGALATYTALLPAKAHASLSYNPTFFPMLLMGLGIVFSLVIIGQGVLADRRTAEAAHEPEHPHDVRRVLALVAVVGVYFAAMPVFGFLVTSAIFIPAFTLILGYRNWTVTVALAVLGPVAVWLVFTYGLKAPLPTFMGG